MTWNGVAYALRQTNPEYQYIYLKEGTSVWMDGMLLLSNAKNSENAHKLINFLLRADVAKEVTETYPYATTNQAAYEILNPEMKSSHILYPEVIPNEEFELGLSVGVDIYLDYWNRLRSSKLQ
jgi:spermidine/putrescine transport system substrate-binding protein